MLHSLTLPKYNTVKQYEGKGNFAISKYYKFPWRFFYRHKLKMIVKLLPKKVHNTLDFGSGPGIFEKELKKRSRYVIQYDIGDVLNPRWRFDVIVCSSVLEFCHLPTTLPLLKKLLKPGGCIVVGSPMKTRLTNLYFKSINDKLTRNSHTEILSQMSKYFKISDYNEWFGMYFSLRAICTT